MTSTILVILLLLVFGVILGIVLIYNRLITNRNYVQEGWSGIAVQLKRRADLIPNLINAVKGYMGHERGVLEKVTELRSKTLQPQTIPERAETEGMLSQALSKIFALAENYPELKANTNFLDLQKNLSEIEEQIQLARRYYNGATRNYNILIESFPSNLVAKFFNFQTHPYFELENAKESEVPVVNF